MTKVFTYFKVEYDRMVMKLSIYLNAAVGIFDQVFPKMKLIYSTRSPKATMPSYFSHMQSPMFSLSLRHREWQEANFHCACFDYEDEYLQEIRMKLHHENKDLAVPNYPSDMGYLYSAAVLAYLKYKKFYKRCVLYEDLLADPVGETTKMFEALGVPTEHVSRALTAMERHSQNHVFGDPNEVKYKKLTKEQLNIVRNAFKNMRTPFDLETSVDEYRCIVQTK